MSLEQELRYPHANVPTAGARQEVAPGVFWLRMPLPFALDHVNLWLLRDGAGYAIVDTGYALDVVRELWERVLDGLGDAPVTRIIVTHCHPDHLGLADWLSVRTGAEIWMTLGEFATAHGIYHDLPPYGVEAMLAGFRRHGLSGEPLAALEKRGNAYKRGVPELPAAYRRLCDGDVIEIDGAHWRVIVGHGHSPEHASLHCAERGVLISGDMVLPRISTNVSISSASPEDNVLGLFLDSLGRLDGLPADTLVLPSHGLPFHGLHDRLTALRAHHEARNAELLEACAEPKSAAEVLAVLFRRELDTHQLMFAMGEAIAHMVYLAERGDLLRYEEEGVLRYARA